MYFVRFSSLKAVEYTDPRLYLERVGRWMELREAENCYVLGALPALAVPGNQAVANNTRLFAVEDREQVVAAGVLFNSGCLFLTWATPEMLEVLADLVVRAKCRVDSVYGPAHMSWQFAQMYADRTQQQFEFGRSERIYQLSRPTFVPADSGKMELATDADRSLLTSWVEGFATEADYERGGLGTEQIRDALIAERRLYLWKAPHPVSMAAWVLPTPHGGCINFVYTPPEFRGKGYAKSVVSSLGRHMLASGLRSCFILTDTEDRQTNHLYQAVGARTLCELLRCTIGPVAALKRSVLEGAKMAH